MPPTKNFSLVFKAVPQGLPVARKHLVLEDLPIDLNDVPDSGVIVRNLYNSLDPYMRLMLVGPKTNHYRQPYKLGKPISSLGIAEVLKSSHSILCSISRRYSERELERKAEDPARKSSTDVHPACWLGPLGMPGLTAYSSILKIGKPESGETIFVSSVAGAVSQIVGQMCKLHGLKVIGSAGSATKCALLTKELGFDGAFNYNEEATLVALNRLAPEGIDVYYDNVGGQTLEGALACMRDNGRIVICGMVSQYNSTSSQNTSESEYGVKNVFQFVSKGLTMRGFRVGMRDFGPKYETGFEENMQKWIRDGKIKPIMSEAMGIERSSEAFSGMLEGGNLGKAVLRITTEDEGQRPAETSDDVYHRINL